MKTPRRYTVKKRGDTYKVRDGWKSRDLPDTFGTRAGAQGLADTMERKQGAAAAWFVPNPSVPGGRKPVELITDRAKRYRAQGNVSGPRKCAICGARPGRIDVMHLDGDENNGDKRNLAYGCRSCNTGLGAAFASMGAGVKTRQYNPVGKAPPTFEQWVYAVTHHAPGAHDEGGKIIHATPKHLRIAYNRRIWDVRKSRGAGSADEVPF